MLQAIIYQWIGWIEPWIGWGTPVWTVWIGVVLEVCQVLWTVLEVWEAWEEWIITDHLPWDLPLCMEGHDLLVGAYLLALAEDQGTIHLIVLDTVIENLFL